jgi:hypothetical protein
LINTKQVTGRREIRHESLDDLLADVERLASPNACMLGNWTPGQIFQHLADTMNSSIDGFSGMFSAPVRWVLSLLMKRRFLYKRLPAGFKAPANFVPDATSVEDGLTALKKAMSRLQEDTTRALHPGFGSLTLDEWTQFHLRHAELHMSFLQDGE